MRTLGWALTALGVFLAVFVALRIGDASVPHVYNLNDPQIWLGTAILGSAALAGIAWTRDSQSRTVLKGIALGAAGAALLIAALYLVVFANWGYGGGPTPELTAKAPLNGTWDNQTAMAALEAQGLDPELRHWGSVSEHAEDRAGMDLSIYVSPTGGAEGGQGRGTNSSGPNASSAHAGIELSVSYRPDGALDDDTNTTEWFLEHRPKVEQRFASFLDAFLEATGWRQVGNVTWERSTMIG